MSRASGFPKNWTRSSCHVHSPSRGSYLCWDGNPKRARRSGSERSNTVTRNDKEQSVNSNQGVAGGRSHYIVYPLLVIAILAGVVAVGEGMYSGIPFLAGVGCFFGAWLT